MVDGDSDSAANCQKKKKNVHIDKKCNQLFRILTDSCHTRTITLAPSVSQCLTTSQKTQGHRVHEWCMYISGKLQGLNTNPIIIPTKWTILAPRP